MTVKRDPDAILAAWLEEGPQVLPEVTRRSIAVSMRTTRQSRPPSRRPWRVPNVNGMTRFALAAAAVVAVVFGGLYVLRPATGSGGVGGSGSPAPAASIPTMTKPFTSSEFGYSIRYPADWHIRDDLGPPSGSDLFVGSGDFAAFRALSVVVPDGLVIDDYIVSTLTNSNVSACIRRPDTLEAVTIDGHEGRLRGFCGEPPPATEVEATVVIGRRVYLFTLFWFAETPAPTESEARAWFDAFTATITLDPGTQRRRSGRRRRRSSRPSG